MNLMLRSGVGRLPVVDRDAPTRLMGMLSRGSIATAYRSVLDEEDTRDHGGLPALRIGRMRFWARRGATAP